MILKPHISILLFFPKAKSRGLSTGIKRVAGKGDRLLVVGCGGPNGWVDFEVSKRCPNKNMPENPKDDMSEYHSQCYQLKQFFVNMEVFVQRIG